MYKLIGCLGFVFSSIFSGQVIADRVDEINKAPPVEYCEVATNQFYFGMINRVRGYDRTISDPLGAPDSAMLVEDWNGSTQQEKDFVSKNVFAGWDLIDKMIEEEAFVHFDSLAYQFHTKCVVEREKAMKQSKSQYLGNPERQKQEYARSQG